MKARSAMMFSLLLGVWLLATAPTYAATIDPQLKISAGGKAEAIVVTYNGPQLYDLSSVTFNGGVVKKQLIPEKDFSATLTQESLGSLANNPNVSAVVADKVVEAMEATVGSTQLTLNAARQTVGFPTSMNHVHALGVAVIDSGVAATQYLKLESLVFKDFVAGKTAPYDDNGHGTHIAGILASSYDGNKGLLCQPRLIAVKVLAADGSGKMSTVIDAINWVVANRQTHNIRVMTLSLGAPATVPWYQDPLAQAVEWAWNNGIVVVVSAGNAGPNLGTITSPGNDPLAITVGATDNKTTSEPADDVIAAFSSRGAATDPFRKPDLLAPGTNITSLLAPNSYLAKNYPKNIVNTYLIRLSGTSMAAPMVAAEAAKVLYEWPTITPNQVKNVLLYKGYNLNQEVTAQGYGYGRYADAKSYLNGVGESPETKVSNVNPGLSGSAMSTPDSLSGQLVLDWLMQDGTLVDDQLIRWLQDNRGVDEFLIRWLIDHNLVDQTLIRWLADNTNLIPENVEAQLVRWAFASSYLTTGNVDQNLVRWAVTYPSVESELAYWLSNLNPIVNQQLIWYLEARGVDPTLIRWLTEGSYVDGTLIRWLADLYYLSGIDLNSKLVRWATIEDGRMNNATVTDYLVRWLGTSELLNDPVQPQYNVWVTMYP